MAVIQVGLLLPQAFPEQAYSQVLHFSVGQRATAPTVDQSPAERNNRSPLQRWFETLTSDLNLNWAF